MQDFDKLQTKKTIYVANLSTEITKDPSLLQAAFIPFGDIDNVMLARDPQTQEPLGYAHILFEDEQDCEHAIFNMNN